MIMNRADKLLQFFADNEVNLRKIANNLVSLSFDETTTLEDIHNILNLFAKYNDQPYNSDKQFENTHQIIKPFNDSIIRKTDFLNQSIFNSIHSEHQMLRYLYILQNKDISLTKSMIALGSCTMKLNATSEMVTFSLNICLILYN